MEILKLFFIVLTSYLLGCLSTGYYYVKFSLGMDIRTIGSGSTGATNVSRLCGKKGFIFCFCGDLFKGMIAIGISRYWHMGTTTTAICLFLVVLGHIFPLQLKFQGGKGIAVTIGALILFDYTLLLLLAITFAILFVFSRIYKGSVLLSFAFLPIETLFIKNTYIHTISLFLVTFLILFAHRKNIIEYVQS